MQALGTTIGAAGGTVVDDSGKVTLVVPAGALDRDVDIGITPAAVAGAVPGTGYELSPSGILFHTPATLTIRYDAGALPPGTDETSLLAAYLHPEGTHLVGNSTVDTGAHAVSAPIIHFTHYGLVSSYLSVAWMTADDTVGVTVTQSAALERVHVGRTCVPDALGHYDPTCIGCRDGDFAVVPPAGSQNWCLYSGSVPGCSVLPAGTYTDYVRATGFYCWRATRNTVGGSETVEVYSFGALTPPATPGDFIATANSDGSVTLSWQGVQGIPGDIDHYIVLRNGAQIATVDGRGVFYRDAGLQPGTTYTYSLLALNDAGSSGAAQTTVTTTSGTSPGCGVIHVSQDGNKLYLNVSNATAGNGSYYWSFSWLTTPPPAGDFQTSIDAPAPGAYTISVFIVGPECSASTMFTVH